MQEYRNGVVSNSLYKNVVLRGDANNFNFVKWHFLLVQILKYYLFSSKSDSGYKEQYVKLVLNRIFY